MAERALVTGATGFIGSHLSEALCARGVAVTAAVRGSSNRRWIEALPVRYVQVDMTTGAGLAAAAAGTDYVYHVAGLTRGHGRREYHAGNHLTTRRLLDAVQSAGGARRRFVYVSSLAAVGPSPPGRPVTETDKPHPISFYGTSKLAAEREVLARADAMPVAIVRPPAVYGPRDTNMIDIFRSAARGWVFLPDRGRAKVSLVYVTDLAAGILLAGESAAALGRTYYVSGAQTTMREVGEALGRILGRRLRAVNIPPLVLKCAGELGELKWLITGRPQIISRRKIRDLLQPSWAVSDDRARRDLGYRPQVGLAEGLAATLRWYQDQGWIR